MKLLKLGDKGQDVKTLQNKLNKLGAKLYVDGDFGDNTNSAVIKFQKDNNLGADGIVGKNTWNKIHLLLNESLEIDNGLFEDYYLDRGEYYHNITDKNTIYLHHTAGGPNPYYVVQYWNKYPVRVATHFVIGGPDKRKPENDGKILRSFDEKYWAHHLGLRKRNNTQLNKQSIGIEICNYGYLRENNGKFYTYVDSVVDPKEVIKLDKPWKGRMYWQDYSDKQIESLKNLLIYLRDEHKINITKCWNTDSFEIDENAMNGIPGIYTHVNVRDDKSDMFPSPKLINMLNTL